MALYDHPIDNDLSRLARTLFKPAIDDARSLEILSRIARNGPQTNYDIWKSTKHRLAKAEIDRRIYGEGNIVGLLPESFLRLEGVGMRKKKHYGLTMKGFLTCLAEVACEDIYMFKVFKETYKLLETHEGALKNWLTNEQVNTYGKTSQAGSRLTY